MKRKKILTIFGTLPEAINAGTDINNIVSGIEVLLLDPIVYKDMSFAHNPYGDGTASKKYLMA